MRKPSAFVSSTCYDLSQVRADLREFLDTLGFEPVLSEFSSFPINPDSTAIENCRKAVEDRADVFILVIGGRYGSTDEQNRSVTNLEYLTARAKGIPIYVFVLRSVLTVIPLWRKNPAADFSDVVESNRVFDFVEEIHSHGYWTSKFDTAQEIASALRIQLGYLFFESLDLRRKAAQTGATKGRVARVSGSEWRLCIERPRSWEQRLFAAALQRELAASIDLKLDWTYQVALGPQETMNPKDFFKWIQRKNNECSRLFGILTQLIQQALPFAMGPPGVAGDPDLILYVANRFGDVYRSILKWKLEFSRVSVHSELNTIKEISSRLLDNCVDEIEEYVPTLLRTLEEVLASPPAATPVNVTLILTVLDLSEHKAECDRLSVLFAEGQIEWDQ